MAQLPEVFNPAEVEPTGGSQGLPISDDNGYLVRITDSRWVPFKNNPTGGRLLFDLEIIEGANSGKKGAYGLNLGHENAQTVEIARGELSALCHVIGVFNAVTDTNVLHGKPFKICVRQQKKSPEYTEIWKVLDQHGRSAKEVKGAGPAAVQPGPAAPAAPVAAPAPAMAAPAAPMAAPAPVAAAPVMAAPAMPPAPPAMAAPVAAPPAPAMAAPVAAPAPPAVAPAPAVAAPLVAPAPVMAAPVAPAMAPPAAPAAAAPAVSGAPWDVPTQ